MSGRLFYSTNTRIEGSKSPQKIYSFICSSCGTTDRVGPVPYGQNAAQSAIPKKMHERGWQLGRRERDDLCPACIANIVKRKREERQEEVPMPDTTNVITMPPQPPADRAMTREDKRVIYATIEQHYLSEQQGYERDWTDNRIAVDLNVPRAWVTEVRDQMFGPAGHNEDILALPGLLATLDERIAQASIRLNNFEHTLTSERETLKALIHDRNGLSIKITQIMVAVGLTTKRSA
jgi:hypothetical protein